jgi:hypothetical protein
MIRRFNRYELKYIIDSRRCDALVKDLKNFMIPDVHGDGDGYYRIVSLYYDSPTLSGYWSKIDGLRFRRKLRLRIYPGKDMRDVKLGFVEIKQRTNRTVQKKRVILPLDQAERLCNDCVIPEGLDDEDMVAAQEIAYMIRSLSLRPRCIVSYRRLAFEGSRYEKGMRLTFDMQLQGRIHALKVNEVAHNDYFMPPDQFVMEVKVNERIPGWMTSLLARHDCQLTRISKYCASIAHGLRSRQTAINHKENIYG